MLLLAMSGWSNEFKVGLLAVGAVVGATWAVLRLDDRPAGALDGVEVYAYFTSAEGVFPTTQVRLAGVSIGSVRQVSLEDGRAKLLIELSGDAKLPADSKVELRAEGVLGDKYVRVTPGEAEEIVHSGQILDTLPEKPGFDQLMAKGDGIADNVLNITASTSSLLDDPMVAAGILETIENVRATSANLREISETQRLQLAAMSETLKALTETLSAQASRTGGDIDGQLAALKAATEKLDQTLAHVEEITGKVNNGEGTLGQLINDTATIDSLNQTLGKVSEVVDTVTGIQTEVYYRGDYFFGSDPSESGFASNPMSGGTRNLIGLRLMPRQDYWYLFELVDTPTGDISETEHIYPDQGISYTEYERKPTFKYTLQFAKRWHDVVLRLGLKEGAGGVGVDYLLARDRITLTADLYDFGYGSWPLLDGTPNLTVMGRWSPAKHVYVEGGWDNLIFGLRHGYATGFLGAGFYFTDNDFKWVLATLPFPG